MKRNFIKLSALILSFAIVSCSKENISPSVGTDITGNYKFISLQAKTTSTMEAASGSDISKTVTTSDYTTQDNSGSVTIDANTFTSSNIAYSVNTVANATIYANGEIIGTFPQPIQTTIPASNGTATYKRIGTDSIYFVSGSILMGGTTQASQPAGAKIKIENGNLILTSNVLQSSTSTIQGETVNSTAQATSIVTLQKQ